MLLLFLFLINLYSMFYKEGRDEATPDLQLVADVIEHIDRHGEPGKQQTALKNDPILLELWSRLYF